MDSITKALWLWFGCPSEQIVMLALLHERHDLTDLQYEFEKGERLRQPRGFTAWRTLSVCLDPRRCLAF